MKYMPHILILLFAGCSLQGSDDTLSTFNNGTNTPTPPQRHLERSDLVSARAEYRQTLEVDPDNGPAAAGFAITDLLLLPYDASVTAIIIEDLGGTGALNQNRDIIYGDQGILSFLVKGAAWEDDGMFRGLRSILEPDLPWSGERIRRMDAFFEPLDTPVNDMMTRATIFADAIGRIQSNIQIALDDEAFQTLTIPSQVFQHPTLTVNLNHSDLAMLNAGLSSVRGVIHFFAGYDYDFTLSEAFGERWERIKADSTDPLHVPNSNYDDYFIRFLDAKVFRNIIAGERLASSGALMQDAIRNLRLALRFAESPSPGTFEWGNVQGSSINAAEAMLQALSASFDGPSQLPDVLPVSSLDLSPFFSDGKTLPAELPWMVLVEDEFLPGAFFWEVSEEAFDEMFASILNPAISDETQYTKANDVEMLFENLTTTAVNDFEDIYFSTF